MSPAQRQKASPKRQAAPTSPAGFAVLARSHPRGMQLPTHRHRRGQLVYALAGVMLVDTPGRRWTVPPQQALWVPPGQDHAIRMLSRTELRTVYVEPALIARCPHFRRRAEVHAVEASPLLRELVLCLFEPAGDGHLQPLAARLLLHALRETPALATDLPLPRSDGLRRAVEAVLAKPRWQARLADCAALAAMSERSFSRHFTAELGMSFRAWRQRARIVASLDALAQGRPVKQIADRLGFASAAAYTAAFRALLHATPREWRQTSSS